MPARKVAHPNAPFHLGLLSALLVPRVHQVKRPPITPVRGHVSSWVRATLPHSSLPACQRLHGDKGRWGVKKVEAMVVKRQPEAGKERTAPMDLISSIHGERIHNAMLTFSFDDVDQRLAEHGARHLGGTCVFSSPLTTC
ncbi:hypothetical protein B0H11DRAFT_2246363 [Mycena galericulata]|nr:hypothetical protein B0H11DRAFT_2246363 [Mycena galericulata]